MSTTIPDETLYRWRCILSDLGIPADDLDDAQLAREATLREMIARLGGCRMLPGSWDKRFVRSVGTFPAILTEKQERAIGSLWLKYRAQLRRLRSKYRSKGVAYLAVVPELAWPDWLPETPDPWNVTDDDGKYVAPAERRARRERGQA